MQREKSNKVSVFKTPVEFIHEIDFKRLARLENYNEMFGNGNTFELPPDLEGEEGEESGEGDENEDREPKVRQVLQNEANQNEANEYEINIYQHQDIPISLIIRRYGNKFCFGIKCRVPEKYNDVAMHYQIQLFYANNRNSWGSLSENMYNYDDGHKNGMGPFSIERTGLEKSLLDSDFIKDGKFKVKITIKTMTTEIAEGMMLRKIYEKICIDGIKEEIDGLVKEIANIRDKNEKLVNDFAPITEQTNELRKKIVIEKQIAIDLDHNHNLIKEVNLKFRGQLTGLNDQIAIMEKKTSVGNLQGFLREFKPEDLDLDKYSVEQLKQLTIKLMLFQKMIIEHIKEEELCSICMERRRSEAMLPCGHLNYCNKCIIEVSRKKKMVCSVCNNKATSTASIIF